MAQGDVVELQNAALVTEKIVRDRERQARQDKKAIEFMEGDVKRVRGEAQELRETIEQRELEARNLRRDLETSQCEFKSVVARFEKLHKTLETKEEALARKRIELEKVTALLSEANKAIKHKETLLRARERRVEELERYVRQV